MTSVRSRVSTHIELCDCGVIGLMPRVGVFDSGIGGLSVVSLIASKVSARFVYFADEAVAPYGGLEANKIQSRVAAALEWFREDGLRTVVLGCNTAEAVSAAVRQGFDDLLIFSPIASTVPSLNPTCGQRVAVFCTEATAKAGTYKKMIEDRYPNVNVETYAIPGLASGIEQRAPADQLRKLLVDPVDECRGAQTIILGCTHYHFVSGLIREMADADIEIVDSAAEVAKSFCTHAAGLKSSLQLLSSAKGSSLFANAMRCVNQTK